MIKRMAALAVAGAFLLLGACGDDDSDEAGDGSDTTEETTGDESQSGAGGDDNGGGGGDTEGGGAQAGYTDGMRSAFVSSCTAQQGATDSECECAFDRISENVPIEEFVGWTEAYAQDPSAPPPAGVMDAVTTCREGG